MKSAYRGAQYDDAAFSSAAIQCEFRNNTAWGELRGGGAIYTQAAPTSWVWNSSFYGNKCPENGKSQPIISIRRLTCQSFLHGFSSLETSALKTVKQPNQVGASLVENRRALNKGCFISLFTIG